MDCLKKELLEDLIDGELDESQAIQAMAHIRSCKQCQHEFVEMLALYEGLRAVVAEDACPTKATLESYADNALTAGEMMAVKEHLEFCSTCRFHVWLCTASEAELARWQTDEERAHRRHQAMNWGREAVHEVLSCLLPAGLGFWDRMWDSAHQLVEDLRAKAPNDWPTLGAPEHLAGAIGFAGTPDPKVTATSIILVTTLFVAQRITDGEIEAKLGTIATAVDEAGQAFGAGKELRKRLVETVPPILLKFSNSL